MMLNTAKTNPYENDFGLKFVPFLTFFAVEKCWLSIAVFVCFVVVVVGGGFFCGCL